jgi:alkylation response protein AidB-like acyl-CoA dehydrogenase
VVTPERYGGMEMDLISALVVSEGLARDASWAAMHGTHSTMGALPVLLFGSEEQKQRYLPELAGGRKIGAFCLTEAQSGTDALNLETQATPDPDEAQYTLNGQKMWVSNGSVAGLYTVFATIPGKGVTAFLAERDWPGVQPGRTERISGLEGFPVAPVAFDQVRTPAANMLGEAGQGGAVAFNVLSVAKLLLSAFAAGAGKQAIALALARCRGRQSLGRPISEFGFVRSELGGMAAMTYAMESLAYRVAGMVQGRLEGVCWDDPRAAQEMVASISEFSAECAAAKAFASAALNRTAAGCAALHGAAGYPVAALAGRMVRDAHVFRILAGADEVNRLLVARLLLRRARQRRLPLLEAVSGILQHTFNGSKAGESRGHLELIAMARRAALFAFGEAFRKYHAELEHAQEVLLLLADMTMHLLTMESAALRAARQEDSSGADTHLTLASICIQESMEEFERLAQRMLAASAQGDALRQSQAVLRRLLKRSPPDLAALKQSAARNLLEAGRYAV